MPKKARGTEMTLAPCVRALGRSVAVRFNKSKVATLDWEAEKRYALELLENPNNEYLRDCALENPASLASAMLDLSRLGLSLSPTTGYAYLIPRKTNGVAMICAAPSYKGMEQVVLRSGKVALIQADLVYENDTFDRWTDEAGAHFKHVHARKDRGAFEAAYCLAKFANGESHLEVMSAEEIEACHQAAIRQNKGKDTPAWLYFPVPMCMKCVVRRAAKHWPSDHHIERLIEQFDKIDPMDFGDSGPVDPIEGGEVCLSEEDVSAIESILTQVPTEARGVWVQRCAEAMGLPGGPQSVPLSRKGELESRLLGRMVKVYGQA